MKFSPAPLAGAFVIELEQREDERGWFARFFCEREFGQAGLAKSFVQVNNSFSRHAGTLRGMHYQIPPRGEVKVVRCIRGALYDVIIDLRRESPTFGRTFGAELSGENRRMMYVPERFAHGFVTLEDDSEALYLVSEFYSPEHERGIRWNDPYFGIEWPVTPKLMSDKDRAFPDFDAAAGL